MLALVAACCLVGQTAAMPHSIYDFTKNSIDGKPVALSTYKGKVLLVVNVASYCGNTPQYKGLEAMYGHYKSQGFAVLGFPANEFGHQEPGTNQEIKEFCEATYHVDFPMFSKIIVKGEGIDPLYSWLIAQAPRHDDIEWNFAKFLVDRHGHVIGRFSPKTLPDDPALVQAIDAALAKH